MMYATAVLAIIASRTSVSDAFSPSVVSRSRQRGVESCRVVCFSADKKEWTSDFDDLYEDDDDKDFELPEFSLKSDNEEEEEDDDDKPQSMEEQSDLLKSLAKAVSTTTRQDLAGIQQRQFGLGEDIILEDFAGSMGFDEVTDWEYYQQDEDTGDRQVVEPPPLDPSKPKRTRERVGSVIRIFRGEFIGTLAGAIRSQGLDSRVLVKEFSGDLALDLARAELASVAKLQSSLCNDEDWSGSALARRSSSSTADQRQDNTRVCTLLQKLRDDASYLGILGQVNMAELQENDDLDANEWYRALSVPPPKPNSIWIVYEYAGLSTAQMYCQPALMRRASIPPKRGMFGTVVQPPSLPKWSERSNYVVKGILKGALDSLAQLHEAGIVHKSIGRTSLLLSSTAMDKTEAASPFATLPSMLRMKLADFGFSETIQESIVDEDVRRRARGFGMSVVNKQDAEALEDYVKAEDLHALGFVFLALLLTSLAEPPSAEYTMPNVDDDSLKRQLDDIFNKEMYEFRSYVEAEGDLWANVVDLLDRHDGAGWQLLQSMCMAREDAAKQKDVKSARELLSSPFFTK